MSHPHTPLNDSNHIFSFILPLPSFFLFLSSFLPSSFPSFAPLFFLPLSLHYRLGMYRDAESQFKSSLKHFSTIDMFLYLGKVYIKLDQPLSALDYYKRVSVTIIGEISLPLPTPLLLMRLVFALRIHAEVVNEEGGTICLLHAVINVCHTIVWDYA